MKRWLPVLLLSGLFTAFLSCRKAPDGTSPIPFISLLSLTPDTVRANSIKDTIFLTFGFTDGDGDLGNNPTTGNYDVYLKDSRDTSFPIIRHLFPEIPEDAVDPIEGLKGTGQIDIRGVTLQLRKDTLHVRHGDTLTLTMWILDRAGNKSNEIITPPIYIRPE